MSIVYIALAGIVVAILWQFPSIRWRIKAGLAAASVFAVVMIAITEGRILDDLS